MKLRSLCLLLLTSLMLQAMERYERRGSMLVGEGDEELNPNINALLKRPEMLGWQLIIAAKNGDKEAAEALLDQDADYNLEDDDGLTALMFAADKGHTDIVKLLLDKGAEQRGMALIFAAIEGHTAIVKLLLEYKVDPNFQDPLRVTALMVAAGEGDTDTVKLLLDKGANQDLTDDAGRTAFDWAIESGHAETAELLFEHGR